MGSRFGEEGRRLSYGTYLARIEGFSDEMGRLQRRLDEPSL
jgi:hypothetical protein